jgi:glycosyltransferase involved in cell wall biosynthesis
MNALSDNAIRIAYLSLEAPREGQATFTHVKEIVDGLRRRGFWVEIHVPSYTGRERSPSALRRILEYTVLQARLIWHWADYDLIYVRAHFMAFPVAWFARWTRRPIVHEVNGAYVDVMIAHPWVRTFSIPLQWLQRSQFRSADALIAVTEQLEKWLRSEGCVNRIDVIPNGADPELFSPQRRSTMALAAEYAVYFGGLTRWHGVEVILDAIQLPQWPADVGLVIIGDGQLRDLVGARAATDPRIHWLGRLKYEETGGVVASALAGLVVINSRGDRGRTGMFPLKLFETLASGIPAIVTDYPGQADLVRTHDCGMVIPPDDAAALASAVAQLANNRAQARAQGARGRALIVKGHSWDHRAAVTAEIIMRILDRTWTSMEPASAPRSQHQNMSDQQLDP